MFTGIIEKLGKISRFIQKSSGAEITIEVQNNWEDLMIGESIAINGACLTLTQFKKQELKFDISPETLKRTTLRLLKPGDIVNMERALKLGDRLGGHLVLGHVDGIGIIKNILKSGNFYTFDIEIPKQLTKYTAEKGSVAIDGISLTIAKKEDNILEIAVIPHTFSQTNLHLKRIGDKVNIEVDIIARYIENLINNRNSELTIDFLKKYGFA